MHGLLTHHLLLLEHLFLHYKRLLQGIRLCIEPSSCQLLPCQTIPLLSPADTDAGCDQEAAAYYPEDYDYTNGQVRIDGSASAVKAYIGAVLLVLAFRTIAHVIAYIRRIACATTLSNLA